MSRTNQTQALSLTSAPVAGVAYVLAFGAYLTLALDLSAAAVLPAMLIGALLALVAVVVCRAQGRDPRAEDLRRAGFTAAALLALAAGLVAVGGVAAIVGPFVALFAIAVGWGLLA